jgi:hypothetical protein
MLTKLKNEKKNDWDEHLGGNVISLLYYLQS